CSSRRRHTRFSRDWSSDVCSSDLSTEAVFTLSDTEETRTVYPFAFRLSLRYKLLDSVLVCTYEVTSKHTNDPLFFSIGGHPAFEIGRASCRERVWVMGGKVVLRKN